MQSSSSLPPPAPWLRSDLYRKYLKPQKRLEQETDLVAAQGVQSDARDHAQRLNTE
jgi:hypothetical protein